MKAKYQRPGPPSYPGPVWQSQRSAARAGPATPWHRVSAWTARHRRLLAALLLCAAAALAVQTLTPARAATATVLVASQDIAAGHVLGQGDLMPADVSPAMVPAGALLPADDWAGGQISGPLRRGEVLTDASLLGNGLLTGAPPGSQAVPIRLSDPSVLTLLRQGQLVTVVLSSSEGLDGPITNNVLAEAVPVLWTPALAGTTDGLLPAQQDEGILVVAASASAAVILAGAISRGKVSLILLN